MRLILAFAVAAAVAGTSAARVPDWRAARLAHVEMSPAAAVHVIDGDTLRFDGQRYRLRNADAPELGARAACTAEADAGVRARDFLRERLARAQRIEARGWRDLWAYDSYGRRLAYVLVDGDDLGAALIARGLAVRHGRTPHWCPPRASLGDRIWFDPRVRAMRDAIGDRRAGLLVLLGAGAMLALGGLVALNVLNAVVRGR